MLPRTYDDQNCSIARALEVLGDRWTLLVIRDAFLGLRRFDDFQRDLGVARNVLADRLGRLVDEGILHRHRYQERPERFEYRLTAKGRELWPVTMALLRWGDRYYAGDGPPRLIRHRGCGGAVTERLRCDRCGADLDLGDVEAVFGPGARRHGEGDPIDDRPAAA
ncbi:MAG TPA: helix-turn-helix domain-containing protein [Solirubrobacteraceae bacterium]|nr:helix-turn-helix domain-containing protein [Solirubrobacteraceae bacterium]